MPTIALTVPAILPIAAMRQHLARALPDWKWRCGDDDAGGPQDQATFSRPQTIMGHAAGGIVMMTIESRDQPLPLESGAPPNRFHLHLSQPSTDDAEVAKRLTLVVCATLAAQNAGARCQIAVDGKWYSAEEMDELALCSASPASRAIDENPLASGNPQVASLHPEAMSAETLPQPFPRRASSGGFGRKGL